MGEVAEAGDLAVDNWSTRGRSEEAAVYAQALRDEAALARRHWVTAVLFDLAKAYETVRL